MKKQIDTAVEDAHRKEQSRAEAVARGGYEILNDAVHLAMEQAALSFGGSDGIFNAANFSAVFMRMANLNGVLDGHVVRLMLTGRADVKRIGAAHWQVKTA